MHWIETTTLTNNETTMRMKHTPTLTDVLMLATLRAKGSKGRGSKGFVL